MMNTTNLIGRLTKDAKFNYATSGKGVANFTLAVQRDFSNQHGVKEVDYINCVIWDKQAEVLANYTSKGSLIGVTGRIQTRSYDSEKGDRVYVTEIVCNGFQMLEPKKVNEQRNNMQAKNQQEAPPVNNQSYNGPVQQQEAPPANNQGYNGPVQQQEVPPVNN